MKNLKENVMTEKKSLMIRSLTMINQEVIRSLTKRNPMMTNQEAIKNLGKRKKDKKTSI